jgi:spermidine/putrescine transport system permease protein
MKLKSSLNEIYLTFPSFMWLIIFFLIPTLIVFSYAFKPADMYGGIEEGWTFETLKVLTNPRYYWLIWRTIWLSSATTVICLFLALPIGYQLATCSKKLKQFLLLLIVVPFWSSFLIRIFAWKTLLHPEGSFKIFLNWLHIIKPETTLLYNSAAVLLVMVYTYLPFAVFPIYAASAKFNFQLMEAAMDLGASHSKAFVKVFIPGIKKGFSTALLMVFIPAIGAYVIPDLVGGVNSEMIGNKIAEKTFIERNLPQASALSALLSLVVLIAMLIINRLSTHSKLFDTSTRNRE